MLHIIQMTTALDLFFCVHTKCLFCVVSVLHVHVHVCIFIVQILYNKAYAELQLGRKEQCLQLLQNGQEIASGASESRHRIICNALDNLRVSEREGGSK